MFLCCVRGEKEEDTGPKRLKLVVVGDGDCGKTCLLYRFSYDEFFTKYIPTVFEVETKTVYYKEKQVELVMFDTAGQEDYDRLRPFSYNDTDIAIVCFSIDSPDSLDNVMLNWVPEIRYFCGNIPILLVGNKKDLRDAHSTQVLHTDPIEAAEIQMAEKEPASINTIKYDEGLATATKIEAVGYYETSAKLGVGTDALFEAVIRAGMESKVKKSTGLFRFRKT
ncbi:ras-like GTP-binding protein RHO [Littorina saxatilis]|uniref:Uncharacterized protein n=1 Tax=Littorina saxatilis TaxID=31220 RepID=A0AAN9BMC2_9CAEN